ncbi:MAG: glycosyltransferase family 4 protein [Rhodocyclaceae bacterium]|nr:glycosyltransferase family 4 protein [Rhodocyclaceae bacterium]
MRLLYAFPEPLPLPRARGVQVAHAVASLVAAGIDVDLAYVPVAGQSPLVPAGITAADGLGLVPLSRGWPSPLDRIPPFARWHSVRFFARRLLREIAQRRPDALYVRHLKLAALLLAEPGLPPLIYEAHEVFADTAKPQRRERTLAMERAVVAGAAAVVCNSRATAERLTALYGAPRRLLVLPNGVTPLATLPEKPWQDCRRHVVYAGSFFGWKGVADLVAAAATLDGFRLTLIGGEPEQIARLRSQLPAGGAQIDFLPRLPHAEVMTHVAAACIAVLPNRPDPDSAFTSPIKLFEYMAAGCAVVTSDLPAIREILGADDAAWFEPGDAASLRDALLALGNDCGRAQEMGRRLHARSADYAWHKRAARLKDFLAGVLSATS